MRRYARSDGKAFVLVACLLIELLTHRAFAQVPEDIRASLTGHGHALLIGVSKYDGDAWPELGGVTADIDDLAKGLAPHFATVDKLIDPTTDAILNALRQFMTGQWNRPDERLLVYYV
jgi:hypothetical protein